MTLTRVRWTDLLAQLKESASVEEEVAFENGEAPQNSAAYGWPSVARESDQACPPGA
ncbi:hypothetical protein AB0F81_16730 [Actinoplanes sp. NPDC024001]|uniref:hypothetical protein n=1 Tax=Actinoplanes sp. NPDC024001 TaxID=3154598 RepID=UPI0033E14549